MNKEEINIELSPSHWLYNAGAIGFLKVLNVCKIDMEKLFKKDGRIEGNIARGLSETVKHNGFSIPLIFWNWLMESGDVLKKDFNRNSNDPVKDIWGTLFNVVYRGFYNANSNLLYQPSKTSQPILTSFLEFIRAFSQYNSEGPTCTFCLRRGTYLYKNQFSSEHYKELGGSDGSSGMPNSFWVNNKSTGTIICDTCSILLLFRHLSFTKLMDGTNIFINAPSFRLMYELNKLLSSFASKENTSHRNLLAMSVIEFSVKTNIVLHTWAGMDIEIVAIKRNGEIEFISLPYESIKLLSNKRIAALLNSIGEFRILNMVIDHKWNDLVELSYRLLKIAMNGIGKEDRDFIGKFYRPDSYQNETSLKILANKLMQLYSLIEERTKKNDYASTV